MSGACKKQPDHFMADLQNLLVKNQLFAELYRVVKATFAEPCMVSALKQ